ncbi:unnamed protein product [Haemonchus placei]|uniref:HEPN domain-containing protein n=1 Tax=Haemonchus placei TaxID=6290 RepID=A0A0N4X622_HAEPC|nr:unnamed protein product [Haemonchus placei]
MRERFNRACIEDLMMQARKIKYDTIGLTEKRCHHSLQAALEIGKELLLGTKKASVPSGSSSVNSTLNLAQKNS